MCFNYSDNLYYHQLAQQISLIDKPVIFPRATNTLEGEDEYIYIQGVTGGTDQTSGGVPYVKLYRYNPKHLYPKLNGYGDNGKRSLKL